MNVLFVCTQNQWRSPTAEKVFAQVPGWKVQSAGTASNARIPLNEKHITWADLIFVMEPKHREIVWQRYKHLFAGNQKELICLQIPDYYHFMDPSLIELLKKTIKEYVEVDV